MITIGLSDDKEQICYKKLKKYIRRFQRENPIRISVCVHMEENSTQEDEEKCALFLDDLESAKEQNNIRHLFTYPYFSRRLYEIYHDKLLKKEEHIWLRCREVYYSFAVHDIFCIKKKIFGTVIWTSDGRIECGESIRRIERKLGVKQFYRIHRHYIINLEYVEGLGRNQTICLKKQERMFLLPVDQEKRDGFLHAFAAYIGRII